MTPEYIAGLYRKHAAALARVREDQRRLYAIRGDTHLERSFPPYRLVRAALGVLGIPAHWKRRLKPQLDDLESEITYLLVRDLAPRTVVEIAPDRGWSTTWMLAALRDNGAGHLFSYDIFDHATRAVPRDLADGRWTFVLGDITRGLDRLPPGIDYLFLDCAHSAEFARWYLTELIGRLAPGTPVQIHDIFPDQSRVDRFGEAQLVQDWLRENGIDYFTASPRAAQAAFDRLWEVKRELGLAEPIHWSQKNPMVFLRAP